MIFFFIPVKLSWGFQARVIGVQDGNTIRVLHSGHLDFVGLYGVLAPEKDQPFGQKAIQFLSSLLVDRDVEITPVKVVRDGHMYGIIAVDGKSVNRQMIAFGLGWVDIDNCSKPECREWITLQDRVGPSAKGIWSLAPIRPDEKPKFVKIEMRCRKCGRIHKLYLLFGNDPRLTAPARKDGYSPFPESNTIICSCGAKVDLTRFRREVEANYRQ